MSVRPHHGTTGLPPDGFLFNLIFQYFSKICRENSSIFNLLASEFGIYILAHPVCKMRIRQKPKKGSIMK
jgi:hypothetical protein